MKYVYKHLSSLLTLYSDLKQFISPSDNFKMKHFTRSIRFIWVISKHVCKQLYITSYKEVLRTVVCFFFFAKCLCLIYMFEKNDVYQVFCELESKLLFIGSLKWSFLLHFAVVDQNEKIGYDCMDVFL